MNTYIHSRKEDEDPFSNLVPSNSPYFSSSMQVSQTIQEYMTDAQDEGYSDNDEDAGTIHKVAREILDGNMKGFSVSVEDGAAMSAIGPLCSRFAEALRDKVQYRYLLTNKGGNAQKLVNIIQMLLDYPISDTSLKPGLLKALMRISTRASVFPTCIGAFQKHSVALKVIKIYREKHVSDMLKSLWKEGILWANLSHPNIIPFYGIYHLHNMEEQVCLVSPWMEEGNILDFLSRNPAKNRVKLLYEIAQGMQYLHENNVIHGDLKGANVLITDSGRACLCDFGLSMVTVDADIMAYTSIETIPQSNGTLRYQAPELFVSQDAAETKVTKECDIYAFSCLCYEVFTTKVPFYEIQFEPAVVYQVYNGNRPTRPPSSDPSWHYWGLTEALWNLMWRCWSQNAMQRPNAIDITHMLRLNVSDGDRLWRENKELFSSAAFRRPLYDVAFMAMSTFIEPRTDDNTNELFVLSDEPRIRLWRLRSIFGMQTDLSSCSTFTAPSTYSDIRTVRTGSNYRSSAPSILSSALSTLSDDTFYAGKSQKEPYKVLLLGPSYAGKSTIIKQLKHLYGGDFSTSERYDYLDIILQNYSDAIRTILNYMTERSMRCSSPSGKRSFQDLHRYLIVEGAHCDVPSYIRWLSASLEIFLNDPTVRTIMAGDWARYRLSAADKYFLGQPCLFKNLDYLPTTNGIVHTNQKTTGIWETDIEIRNLHIRIYDVGGARSERKKWINRFESITSVIFCAALDHYYQVLLEDSSINRMEDSIDLFYAIHTSRWFTGKPTILLLNKFDAFKDILLKIPLKDSEYEGGADVSKAVRFILGKYKKSVELEPKPIYTHLLQATDLRNVIQVFRTIRDEILMTALEDHVSNLKLM